MAADTDSLDVAKIAEDLGLDKKSDAGAIRQQCLNAGYSVFQAGYIAGWLRTDHIFNPNEMAPVGYSAEVIAEVPAEEKVEKPKQDKGANSPMQAVREKLQSGSDVSRHEEKLHTEPSLKDKTEKPLTFQERADALEEKK